MIRMIRPLFALSVVGLVTACAGHDTMAAGPMMQGRADAGGCMPMADMAPHMQAMQAMHEKMRAAKTPAEREALMADHMKAMQGGMAMMKERPAMGGMGGMADGACKPGEAGGQHRMMQMMMDMMADRMPAAPAAR